MNPSVDTTLRNLNDCGCCQGRSAQTPVHLDNRPGLKAIAYRVGTHSQFKQTMLAALSDSGRPALQDLNTRDEDDFSIALLDAWSVVADVLTFYQDRIANESYLRTATERRSVLEMARAIGYQLNPGVAAGTYLAFTLETAKGSPSSTKISIGAKAQSVPGPDEKAQTFETVEEIVAYGALNEMKPRLSVPQEIKRNTTKLYLKGTDTQLQSGDVILLVGDAREEAPLSERWDFRILQTVTTDDKNNRTLVTWEGDLGRYELNDDGEPVSTVVPDENAKIFAFRQKASLFGHNAPDWRVMADDIKDKYMMGLQAEYFQGTDLNPSNCKVKRIDPQVNFDWGSGSPHPVIPSDNFSVRWKGLIKPPTSGSYTFYTLSDDGVRLWIEDQKIIDNWTDHAAIENSGTIQLEAGKMYVIRLQYYEKGGLATIKLYWSGPSHSKEIIPQTYLHPLCNYDEWPGFTISAISSPNIDTVYLDKVYEQITPGGWLVLSLPTYQELYEVVNAVEDSRVDFTLASKATRIELKGDNLVEEFDNHVRDTVVFAQSEQLELAEQPLDRPVFGSSVILGKSVKNLEPSRMLVVSGKPLQYLKVAEREHLIIIDGKEYPQTEEQLSLVFADGSVQALKSGDKLEIVSPPKKTDEGLEWYFKNSSGTSGSVKAEPDDFIPVPTDDSDETGNKAASATEDEGIVGEVVTLDKTESVDGFTKLVFTSELQNIFERESVTINANIAKATHGETTSEVMGSGDAGQPFQSFTLRQWPLTYVSASTTSGAETTLEVRVNDLLWKEVSTFYSHGPDERIYVTRTDDDGKTTVQFGDGRTGARLPTGKENVQASYRKGIGLDGLVKTGQISQAMTRPLGLKSVVNPLPATGAQDSESLDEARRNAPLTVLTLDRIVSLQDYEDFAYAYTGIAKAIANWTWDGEKRAVFVTVAGPKGAAVVQGSTLHDNLLASMRKSGDPNVPLQVESYQKTLFQIGGNFKAHPDYQREKVLAAVEKKLRGHFSFDTRAFGQPVTFSEVVAIIQQVPGVVAVFIDRIYLTGTEAGLNTPLKAKVPQAGEEEVSPAELLTLDPCKLGLEVVS